MPRSKSCGATSADTSFGVARKTTSGFEATVASSENDSLENAATIFAWWWRAKIFCSSMPE
jgi:hypothetical protein